jgi:probable phosphoglycerate mutase
MARARDRNTVVNGRSEGQTRARLQRVLAVSTKLRARQAVRDRPCAGPTRESPRLIQGCMAILLVRHGETVGNAARVVQKPEVPLNERGIWQAARLAERLFEIGFAHVLCSDLLRARMTAEPLRARGAVIEETPLLQERNFGDLRGTPYADLTEDPFAPAYVPPGGESVAVFHRRVAEAFALILERRRALAGPLVVVSHGLLCRALVENHAVVAAPPDHFDNAGLTEIDAAPPFAVRLISCTRHLADAGPGATSAI